MLHAVYKTPLYHAVQTVPALAVQTVFFLEAVHKTVPALQAVKAAVYAGAISSAHFPLWSFAPRAA